MKLNIIFAGTLTFAAIALDALIHSPHHLVAVYTQPDKPAGRGLKLTSSPVKTLALANQLPIYQPSSLKDEIVQRELSAHQADIMVVAAYGMLLPEAVLRIPRLGCINIHPSLLPRWRGAAPIQRTIFAGDKKTGVTMMQMDKGLDTGPMLLQQFYAVAPQETSITLHDVLAKMGAHALLETIDLLAQHKIVPQPQDNQTATYAQKISKEEAHIDWHLSAAQLDQLIRAFQPWPIAFTIWREQTLRIWQAQIIEKVHQQLPGTILNASAAGIDIATGTHILRLLKMQLPGGKVLSVADFYHAKQDVIVIGERLT